MEDPIEQHLTLQASIGDDLIVNKILKSLTLPDLLTCRLVAKNWRRLSSEILTCRRCTHIKFRFKKKTYTNNSSRFKGLLSSLIKILENHQSSNEIFPCTWFTFEGGDLLDEELTTFFQLHGPHVKTLEMNFDSDEWNENDSSIVPLLTVQLPNLEKLILFDEFTDWERPPNFILANLKKLCWTGEDLETKEKIILSSPNLDWINFEQNCDESDILPLRMLINCHHISKLKQLKCSEESDPEILLDVANAEGISIENLKFKISSDFDEQNQDEQWQGLSLAFSNLIDKSKLSLKKLELSTICPYFEIQLNDLVFPLLEELSFDGCEMPCFPNGINFSQSFPKLLTLDFSGLFCDDEDTWSVRFPGPVQAYGRFESVETIKITDDCCSFWMEQIKEICPNFKNIIIYFNGELDTFLKQVFELWNHLKGIEIVKHPSKSHFDPDEILNLDSTITGLNDEDCEKFLNDLKNASYIQNLINRKKVERLRQPIAICNMSELRTLKIHFKISGDCASKLMTESDCDFISKISHTYGFKLVPNLKTTIYYNQNKFPNLVTTGFQEISTFFSLLHETDEQPQDWM